MVTSRNIEANLASTDIIEGGVISGYTISYGSGIGKD
jgi:hypothetical protein